MDFISILSIFVMACFVGYYVVWSVTPALHTPLMAVTNAISSVIIVGALIAGAAAGSQTSKWLGLLAIVLASVNHRFHRINGSFAHQRMLVIESAEQRRFHGGIIRPVPEQTCRRCSPIERLPHG